MPNHPLTGARLGEQTDAPRGGLFLAQVVNELSPYTIPVFATASARDSAYTAWVAQGNAMRDGLYCHLQSDKRLWYYDGTRWTWPRWAQGFITYQSRTTSTTATSAQFQPTEFQVRNILLPTRRRLRIRAVGSVVVTNTDTLPGIRLYLNDTECRRVTPPTPTANVGVPFIAERVLDLNAGTYNFSGEQYRALGSGTVQMVADIANPLEFTIEDLGYVI